MLGRDSGGIADFFWEEKGNLVCGVWCGNGSGGAEIFFSWKALRVGIKILETYGFFMFWEWITVEVKVLVSVGFFFVLGSGALWIMALVKEFVLEGGCCGEVEDFSIL